MRPHGRVLRAARSGAQQFRRAHEHGERRVGRALRGLDHAVLGDGHGAQPLAGGGDGACGRTTLLRAGGQAEVLGSADCGRVFAGDAVEVETPGGGGWGTPPA